MEFGGFVYSAHVLIRRMILAQVLGARLSNHILTNIKNINSGQHSIKLSIWAVRVRSLSPPQSFDHVLPAADNVNNYIQKTKSGPATYSPEHLDRATIVAKSTVPTLIDVHRQLAKTPFQTMYRLTIPVVGLRVRQHSIH